MKLYYDRRVPSLFHEGIICQDTDFLIEQDKWLFTSNVSDADIIPCSFSKFCEGDLPALNDDQILMVYYIETSGAHVSPEYCRQLIINSPMQHKKTIYIHTNALDTTDTKYIHYDIMFNRQKLFATDYDDDICSGNKCWIWGAPKYTYSLSPINKEFSTDNKLFFCPVRVLDNQRSTTNLVGNFNDTKESLRNHLIQLNANMYLSDPVNGVFFEPNGWKDNPEVAHFETRTGGRWYPAADHYYETSYVSVCVESLYQESNIFYPCEKYFDPLLKGNFPLVFAPAHTIQRMKDYYGFVFPDWIDYSYDNIEDIEQRFVSYLDSVTKVSRMSLEDIHQLYVKDKSILEHNRNVFFTKPYDSLYQKVKNAVTQLGWLGTQSS